MGFLDEGDVPPPKRFGVRAYRDGERYEEEDSSRSIILCPTCGWKRVGQDLHSEFGKVKYWCAHHHHWMLDAMTNIVHGDLLL